MPMNWSDGRLFLREGERGGTASKKLLGCSVISGEDSTDEVSGVVAGESVKLLNEREKSESVAVSSDRFEGDTLMAPMSGALSALTLVVEMSCVGSEMRLRSMVLPWNLTLPPRARLDSALLRLTRLVKARARAIVLEAIADLIE